MPPNAKSYAAVISKRFKIIQIYCSFILKLFTIIVSVSAGELIFSETFELPDIKIFTAYFRILSSRLERIKQEYSRFVLFHFR